MRKIILLIILFNTLSHELYSQGCELPPGCEDKEFPYKLCNSNNLLYRCSKNPYNEFDGNTELIPMKLDGCFQYDPLTYSLEEKTTKREYMGVVKHDHIIGYDSSSGRPIYGYKDDKPIYEPGTDNEIIGYNSGGPIFVPYDTHELITEYNTVFTNLTFTDFWGDTCFNFMKFDPDQYPGTRDNSDTALTAWKRICDTCELNNHYLQNCCVKISWTKKKELFTDRGYDPSEILAFTHAEMISASINPCDYYCDSLYVYINQTDAFTGNNESDPGNYTRHFFITGQTSKDGWYSLTATFMHEMGHLFGFGDQYPGDTLNCDYPNSIMNGTDLENPNRGLSSDDICMYMKMYCWTPPTDVDEITEKGMAVRIFPNPTNNDLINIQFVNPKGLLMTYEITSPLGISVLKGEVQSNENPKTITLNNLSSGLYFLILKHEGKQEMLKFVINK